jgi:GT2 family glycosyltransferase
MTVVATVVHYADREATAACLASLVAGTVVPESIIVIDNEGDVDTAVEAGWQASLLEASETTLEVLRPGANLGYAGAGAEGARRALGAGADWFWLVNNDVEVQRTCLAELLDAGGRHPRAGLLSPLILESGGGIWFAGGAVNWRTLAVHHETKAPLIDHASPTGFASGCAVLARTAMVRECGLPDASLFMYFEDVEWTWRQARGGWTALFVPRAVARHDVARCGRRRVFSPVAVYYMTRNRLVLGRRLGHRWAATAGALSWAARQTAKGPRLRTTGRLAVATVAGFWDGLRGRAGPMTPGLQNRLA